MNVISGWCSIFHPNNPSGSLQSKVWSKERKYAQWMKRKIYDSGVTTQGGWQKGRDRKKKEIEALDYERHSHRIFVFSLSFDCSRAPWATWAPQSRPCSGSRARPLDSPDTWCIPSSCADTLGLPPDSLAIGVHVSASLVRTGPIHRCDCHYCNF